MQTVNDYKKDIWDRIISNSIDSQLLKDLDAEVIERQPVDSLSAFNILDEWAWNVELTRKEHINYYLWKAQWYRDAITNIYNHFADVDNATQAMWEDKIYTAEQLAEQIKRLV